MKLELVKPSLFKERYKNIFLLRNRKIQFSSWYYHQLLFYFWRIHAKLTRRSFSAERQNLELAIKKIKLSGNLIDIGGGSGWMSEYWQGGKNDNYVILDPMFRKSILFSSLYREGRLFFVESKAESIPFRDNTFDISLLCATIDHVEDPMRVLSEISRTLKKNGYLFISHKIDHTNKKYTMSHVSIFTHTQLKNILKRNFIIIKELKSPDKKVVYIWLKNKK